MTFILIADISGGIILNYSKSTRDYYSENSKKHVEDTISIYVLKGAKVDISEIIRNDLNKRKKY